LQYCDEATNDFTQIAAPNARGENVEFVNRGDNTIAPTSILVFDAFERESEVVYGNADKMASNHGEMDGPSALIDDTYINAVAMGEELQICDVLHASGEERMVSEDLSEKEEMEVIDFLTEKCLDRIAQEGVEGLVNISNGGIHASQAQSSNLPPVLSDPPDTTWVINHRGEEVEMEAHDLGNVDKSDDSGSDEDMATSSHLSLDVTLPCSAILSIPTLVFPPEVNEATVVFSQASQEGQSVLYSLQDETPDRLAEIIAPWANSIQKPTTNNRGEELELINVDVDINNEGDDFASAHDMAALVFPPHVDDSTVVFDDSHLASYQCHKLQTNKGMTNDLAHIVSSNIHGEQVEFLTMGEKLIKQPLS